MTWKEEVDRLRYQQSLAKEMGGSDGIARQHSRGRLTIRERIALLLDRDSFREIGSIAGNAELRATRAPDGIQRSVEHE